MRAFKPRNADTHCLRCLLRREICICPVIPSVPTRTEFLILRHIGEAGRPSNTGRLIDLALPNARIIAWGGGTRVGLSPLDDELLQAPGTWLLWPDGPDTKQDVTPPGRIVVLDATWRQARRLYHRTPTLWSLPRLVLPSPAPSRGRLRDQHRADGMSTIEAVAAALAAIEGAKAAEPLEKLYDEVVRRTHVLRWGTTSF
ncbi:MAG: hypothetical protein CVU71_12920 [Deltaproteobacteria bacterium HGW-Deltaproteobacteria-6]|jgi:DTW domain-containing protein YfiP|nr:MAG: hypothetical protein CVU71_12920 [Deltaproteobacteria bacterium HGW-Deltaproteobacteria-6]